MHIYNAVCISICCSAPRKRKRNAKTKSKKKGRRRLQKASNAATELARKAREDWTSTLQDHVDDDYFLSEQSDHEQEDSDDAELTSGKPKVLMAKFMMSSQASMGLRISDGKTCVPTLQQMVRASTTYDCLGLK